MTTVDFRQLTKAVNPAYRPYLTDYRPVQIFKGGSGAGKSYFIGQNRIYNTIGLKGFNGLVVRKVGRDNHDSTFALLCRVIRDMGLEELFDINRSKGAEEISCKLNDNQIIFRGLDDVDQIKSVTFRTGDLSWVWVEEADQTAIDDYRQLTLRLRGKDQPVAVIPTKTPFKKHIILSFNPIDISSWIKTEFFDRPLSKEEGFILETTYHDNEHLDKEYIGKLENLKNIDYYYYQVYVLNQWGARTTARVFHNLEIHDFEVKEHDFTNIRAGADFGFNHANAWELSAMKDGELYIYSEVYAKNILNKVFGERIAAKHIKTRPIICDSADPAYISEFNALGLVAYGAKKGPGSLERGVNWLKSLPKIHIHATNCPNAAREFPRFKYRELKDGTVTDEYVEIDDDTIAAVRYGNEDLANTPAAGAFFVLKRGVR
jgi:phage terminase large subunit